MTKTPTQSFADTEIETGRSAATCVVSQADLLTPEQRQKGIKVEQAIRDMRAREVLQPTEAQKAGSPSAFLYC